MSLVICVKCGRQRSDTYMQEAVFRNFVKDEGAGIWKCASSASCKQERKRLRKEQSGGNLSQDSNAVQA